MAAIHPCGVEDQERVSQYEADLVFQKPRATKRENVLKLIKELRSISFDSQKKLDEVNQYLEELENDDAKWSTETNDPIMTFNLENLRQAFRETVMLSGRYKAACKTLERYLLKLEEHTRATCAIQSGIHGDKLAEAIDETEPLLGRIDQCITRCCDRVDECGSKYGELNAQLTSIIDKYFRPKTIKYSMMDTVPYFLSFLLPSTIQNSQTDSNKQSLHVQQAELEKARQLVMAVVDGSKIIKIRWSSQQNGLH